MKRGPHLAQDTLEPGLSQAPINSSDISCRAIDNRIQPRHFMGTKPTSKTTTGISWDIIMLDTQIWDFSQCRTPYYHHWFPGEKLPPILRSPQDATVTNPPEEWSGRISHRNEGSSIKPSIPFIRSYQQEALSPQDTVQQQFCFAR